MDNETFQSLALRTEPKSYGPCATRAGAQIRLLHGAMTLVTEAGEFLDALKKHIYYGRELDRVNLAEELGDVMWGIAVACDDLGVDVSTAMEKVIEKLKKRYPDDFTEQDALNRDVQHELSHYEP